MAWFRRYCLIGALILISAGRYWGTEVVFLLGGILLSFYAIFSENLRLRITWLCIALLLLSVVPNETHEGRSIDLVIMILSLLGLFYELLFKRRTEKGN